MRKVNRHIIHCSATPKGWSGGAGEIREWHTALPPKGRGWSDIGYHFVILRDGTIEGGRPLERIGAHVKGHNRTTVGTCLVGPGRGLKNFTVAQLKSLYFLHYKALQPQFGPLPLHGHREYANKDCPGFDISELMAKWEKMMWGEKK